MQRIVITALAAALTLSACSGGTETPATDVAADPATANVTIGAGDVYYADGDTKSTDQTLTFNAIAGDVTLTLDNTGAAEHDIVVEEADDTLVTTSPAGASTSGTITLTAGTYTVYCAIPGHRQAGMEAVLEVS